MILMPVLRITGVLMVSLVKEKQKKSVLEEGNDFVERHVTGFATKAFYNYQSSQQ